MAKKPSTDTPTAKRTPDEKAQRKAEKAQRKAAKTPATSPAEKKAQKQTLKAASKQLQKELDNQLNELAARIRKETKARLKAVVKEAAEQFDAEAEQLFGQALQAFAPQADDMVTNVATGTEAAAPPRPASGTAAKKPAASKPAATRKAVSGRPRRPAAPAGAPELSTPRGAANDSNPVDNV